MRKNYRNSIASIKKFPQFTTMNVIDGQAGLIICASLIFYSLTIDNILNIIVLLILAGVSISMLTGDNSLLGNAQKTGPASNIGAAKDEVGLAYNNAMQEYYQEKYASTNGGSGTFASKLETAINEITEKGRNHSCEIAYDTSAGTITITITNGGYKVIGTVDTTDSGAGISWGEMKETTKSLPGSTLSATSSACKEISVANLVYADLDGDATTAEGIIFADKAGNAVTAATAATSGYTMKDYAGETKTSSGKIISKTTATTDNYYVLALADVDANGHCWYYSAYNSGISDYNSVTSTDFGKGSTNTSTMIEKWSKPEYGEKNGDKSYSDMWGIIQNVQDEGWFVPSKDEWKKVFDNLGVNSSKYREYGLNDWYWASSLSNTNGAWNANFNNGSMFGNSVNNSYYVRLVSTF